MKKDENNFFSMRGLVDASFAKIISTDPDQIREYFHKHKNESLRIVEGRVFETSASFYTHWKWNARRHGMGYAIVHPSCNKPFCGNDNLILEKNDSGINILFTSFKDNMLPEKDVRSITKEQIERIKHYIFSRNVFICNTTNNNDEVLNSIMNRLWADGIIAGFVNTHAQIDALSHKDGENLLSAVQSYLKNDMHILLSREHFESKPVDWHDLISQEDFEILCELFNTIKQNSRDLSELKCNIRSVIFSDFYIGKIERQNIENVSHKKFPIVGKTETNLFLAISKVAGNNKTHKKHIRDFMGIDLTKPVGIFLDRNNYGQHNNCPVKLICSFTQENLDKLSALVINCRLGMSIFHKKRSEILRTIATKSGFHMRKEDTCENVPHKTQEEITNKRAQELILSAEKKLRLDLTQQQDEEEEKRLSKLAWTDRLELLKPQFSDFPYEQIARVL